MVPSLKPFYRKRSMVALHPVAPTAEHLKVLGHRLAALRPRHDVIPLHLLKLEVPSAFGADTLLSLIRHPSPFESIIETRRNITIGTLPAMQNRHARDLWSRSACEVSMSLAPMATTMLSHKSAWKLPYLHGGYAHDLLRLTKFFGESNSRFGSLTRGLKTVSIVSTPPFPLPNGPRIFE